MKSGRALMEPPAGQRDSRNWQLPWAPLATDIFNGPNKKSALLHELCSATSTSATSHDSHDPMTAGSKGWIESFYRLKIPAKGRLLGRAGGYKKSVRFQILTPATTPSPDSRVPENVQPQRQLVFQSFEESSFR